MQTALRTVRSSAGRVLSNTAVPLMLALAGIAVATWDYPVFERWSQEDAWLEWATFLAFVAAGVMALWGARSARPWPLAGLALVGLGAFCLFVAGEEVSWGQRLLGFRPPDVFLEKNYQQEANLHNLLKEYLNTRWMVAAIAIGYGVIAPVVALRLRWARPLAPSGLLIPAFVVVAWLEIDYPFDFAGELAEAVLGLIFVVDVVVRTTEDTSGRRQRWSVVAPVAAVLGGLLLTPIIRTMLYGPDPEATALATRQLEVLAKKVEQGAIQERVLTKGRIHKRIYTSVRKGYLYFESDEGKADEFYLDPWHQPYWMLMRRSGVEVYIVLYSFGPNRQRDSQELRTADGSRTFLAGDDVGIVIEGSLY